MQNVVCKIKNKIATQFSNNSAFCIYLYYFAQKSFYYEFGKV